MGNYARAPMTSAVWSEYLGQVIAGRYLLESALRSDAAVFEALDTTRHEHVCIELFAIADDAEAREQFHTQIGAAAELIHPNIATIHDWGTDEVAWVASELCAYGTLDGALVETGSLTPSQAVVLGIEVSRALDYAHELGFVHGRITSAQIALNADLRTRVLGIGLPLHLLGKPDGADPEMQRRRAASYVAPEQANGSPATPASDVWSLALILNEAVSAIAPPIGESLVDTLRMRAEEPVEPDADLDEIRDVVAAAMDRQPTERPTASMFAEALMDVAEGMAAPVAFAWSRPATSPVLADSDPSPGDELDSVGAGSTDAELAEADLSSEFDIFQIDPEPADVDASDLASAGDESAEFDTYDTYDLPPIEGDPAEVDAYDSSLVHDGPSAAVDESVDVPTSDISPLGPTDALDRETVSHVGGGDPIDAPVSVPRSVVATAAIDDDDVGPLPAWPLVALFVLVAAALGAVAVSWLTSGGIGSSSVPDVTGQPFDAASSELIADGWSVERLETRSADAEPGDVVAQSPEPGADASRSEPVSLTVTLGKDLVEIPDDMVGLTVPQAEERLRLVGLNVGSLDRVNSEALASGLVLGTDEPTTQKPEGEAVDLRVSLGPADRQIPNSIIGATIADATATLTSLRIGIVEEEVFDEAVPVGVVVSIIPGPGTSVAADSVVQVQVSAGPAPVVVPDVIGLGLGEARELLEGLGLLFIDSRGTPGEPAIGSAPPAGQEVDVGSEFIIILGEPSDNEEGEPGEPNDGDEVSDN